MWASAWAVRLLESAMVPTAVTSMVDTEAVSMTNRVRNASKAWLSASMDEPTASLDRERGPAWYTELLRRLKDHENDC
jgi:hypothetical protein